MLKAHNCHLCNGTKTITFFDLPPIPTMDGVMSSSREAALGIQKGKVTLQFCKDCGFIQNIGYKGAKIDFGDYDFANDYSPIFREFVNDTANRLINTYDLRSKQVLEIASGDGNFLYRICEIGHNDGVGIDPGFDLSNHKYQTDSKLTFIQDYYSEKHAYLSPDLVICRHMINVLDDPKSVLHLLRRNLNDLHQTIVYLEVPNAEYTFREKVFWNLSYEHGSWFTCETLKALFEICGFKVLRVELCWNDEFIGIEAIPTALKDEQNTFQNPLSTLADTITDFSQGFDKLVSTESERLKEYQQSNLKVVGWGAGARAVTYFNILPNTNLQYIVDINEKRHHKFLPGVGIEIVAPNYLLSYQPDVVIITNPTYAEEIRSHIHTMGLSPEIIVL